MCKTQNKARMQIFPPAPLGHTWDSLMLLALEEARQAKIEEEVPVGAVLVDKAGKILAKAHNLTRKLNDPTAHAEILALRKGCKIIENFRLDEAYIVVTLEPCIMCLGALREARINGIIFGAYDKEIGAVCSFIDGTELALKSPKPWFMGGILEDECSSLLRDFFTLKR